MVSYQYLRYTTWSPGVTHYESKYHSKFLFYAHWNLYWSKRSMELFPEFHGIFFQTTFEQQLWFHGIPWNLTSSSMEFHGILSRSKVPWNSMELIPYSHTSWNSTENHGTSNFPEKAPWNSMELDKFDIQRSHIPKYVFFGIWLMIMCYLTKSLSEPMLKYCCLDPREQSSRKSQSEFILFHSRKCIWKCCLVNEDLFVSASMYQCFWKVSIMAAILFPPQCVRSKWHP